MPSLPQSLGTYTFFPIPALVFPFWQELLNFEKVKVKCTLVQALRLCTGRTAYKGSRGIALPFYDHVTRRGWGVSVTTRPLFTLRKDSVNILQEAGWAPQPVWTAVKSRPTWIRSPDRQDRSQSLYRLSYRANIKFREWNNFSFSRRNFAQFSSPNSIWILYRKSLWLNK